MYDADRYYDDSLYIEPSVTEGDLDPDFFLYEDFDEYYDLEDEEEFSYDDEYDGGYDDFDYDDFDYDDFYSDDLEDN
jgi:hypothetical protein